MPWTLLTNDDGAGSPALRPFAEALQAGRDLRVVVPDSERSWSAKALTRFDPVHASALSDLAGWAHSGLPADGVQLAAAMYGGPPAMVVSGINIGYNHGASYIWSSGTVGAAVEGWAMGSAAVAFSTGSMGEWEAWKGRVLDESSAAEWVRLAALCSVLLAEVEAAGLTAHADVVNINVPFDADGATERRITTVARTTYGHLFSRNGDVTFIHDYDGELAFQGPSEGTDVEAANDGVISITPLRMPDAVGPALS